MKDIESTFESIYSANYPKVMRLCLGYTSGDMMQAKDLTQEIFIKVWENLQSFRNESNISTWIYRITVNTCLIYLRSKKKVSTTNNLNKLEHTNESLDAHNELKYNQLYKCIESLNKDNKSIILLELEGLPQKKIADIMGLTHEAIRVRVHRIKNELTKCVKK